MKYFVSYRFTGADKKELKNKLEIISKSLENTGNDDFTFFRDVEKWQNVKIPINEIVKEAYSNLKKCDGIFVFVDSEEKSEGMLVESGFAKALDKEFVLLIKKDLKFIFLREMADKVIEFENIGEIEEKIKEEL